MRRSPHWLPIALMLQVSLLWILAFAQTDETLLLWARDYTDRFLFGRQLPASIFASVPALLVLILSPLLALAERSSVMQEALRGASCCLSRLSASGLLFRRTPTTA